MKARVSLDRYIAHPKDMAVRLTIADGWTRRPIVAVDLTFEQLGKMLSGTTVDKVEVSILPNKECFNNVTEQNKKENK